MGGSALAQADQPTSGTIGVADVGRILKQYRRTEQVKAYLERTSVSDEQRRKRQEVADLERGSASQGFWFLRRRQDTEELKTKRNELREVAQRDAERAREVEEEAVESLMADVRRAVESTGREEGLAVVFDSALPHILYINSDVGVMKDITDRAIERLNSQ